MNNTSNILRKFHAVCTNYGVEHKQYIARFGLSSSKELDNDQLKEAIEQIEQRAQKWRRRVLAAVGGYCERKGYENKPAVVFPIVKRACKCNDFNRVKIDTLRDVYNQFKNAQ